MNPTDDPIEDYAVKIFVEHVRGQDRACFKIGVQTFFVCEREDKAEAEWYVNVLQTAFDNYALYLGFQAGKLLKEKDDEIAKHKLTMANMFHVIKEVKAEMVRRFELIEKAFVAGRSKSSWEQFKKDHNI
jgi:hypothetical protein